MALIILLIPVLFFAYIYFSHGKVRNFPVGKNTAQINITPGGINIFYPKNDTTFYYSHNFSWPTSEITGTTTKLDDLSSYQGQNSWNISQLTSFFTYLGKKIPVSIEVTSKKSVKDEEKSAFMWPVQEKKFTSKILDFTLTAPEGFSLNSKKESDYEYMEMYKDNENRMTMTIFPAAKGCKDTDYSSGRWDPLRIKIGGKYQVTFTHSSISHGDSGHSYAAQALANNDYCIAVDMNINIRNQKEFTNILEGN